VAKRKKKRKQRSPDDIFDRIARGTFVPEDQPEESTSLTPGTQAKMDLMQQRLSQGKTLYHDDDTTTFIEQNELTQGSGYAIDRVASDGGRFNGVYYLK